MTPLALIDAVHTTSRTLKATVALSFLVLAPGAVLFAVAYLRWRQEYRRG